MNPCEMNALIAALANYLYSTLSKKDFFFWNVFFSELSKSMFGMEILRAVCFFEDDGHNHKHDEKKHEKKREKKAAEDEE